MQSNEWFQEGIATVESAANYIWEGLTTGGTGVINISDELESEIKELWDLYRNSEITLENVKTRAKILES